MADDVVVAAEPLKNPSMLSGFDLLQTLTGTEYVEVVKREPDGSFKNYRVFTNKLRTGASAYDVAVINGFEGTEADWLKTLIGKSAYQAAVDAEVFTGTEAEWVTFMQALYTIAPENHLKVLTAGEDGIAYWADVDLSIVQLDKVDNTSDLDKPLSTAAINALQQKVSISALPGALQDELKRYGFKVSEDGTQLILDQGGLDADAGFAPVQFTRTTAVLHADYKGPVGSLAINTDTFELYVHDGLTAGGHKVNGLSETAINALIAEKPVFIKVASDQELPLVEDAVVDAFYLTEDNHDLYVVSGGALVNLTAAVTIPVKAAADAIDVGTDDDTFVTGKQVHDFVVGKLGYTRSAEGVWTAPDVTPTP